VDDLQATGQGSPLLKFNHELERIAAFHEQATFNSNAGLADIQNLARRRKGPSLQTAAPAYLDT
jgi:hypothetical protein